jgi:hypothetical protein
MCETKLIEYEKAVLEVRKECRQFAMLYFHFCKTLVEELGLEKSKELIHHAVFGLSMERSEKLRDKAKKLGLNFTPESFNKVNDLPVIGWVK